ncbi:MAG: 4Fe-4S binding protein [Armatimonadota bacterium]
MRPYVDEEICVACGTCESVCPASPNVFKVEEKSKVVNPDSCIECGVCETSCPVGAINLKD